MGLSDTVTIEVLPKPAEVAPVDYTELYLAAAILIVGFLIWR